jgi:hypothetical protein
VFNSKQEEEFCSSIARLCPDSGVYHLTCPKGTEVFPVLKWQEREDSHSTPSGIEADLRGDVNYFSICLWCGVTLPKHKENKTRTRKHRQLYTTRR